MPFFKVVGIISNGLVICHLFSFALTTYGRKNNPFICYEREIDVSLMVWPHGGPYGACAREFTGAAFFWVLGFMPLSFWMVPFSLSLSLPFPLSLPPYLYRRPTRPPLCSAWLLDLLHLATQRLCSSSHPSVFPRLAAPYLPPFFPAVGLRIKIRHFIVSKFCEADNIAAPIAAADRRERARAGTLRCWFCYRINRLSDRFRATNKANEPPPSSTDRERPDRWRGCCSAGGRFIWATDGWGRRCLSPAAVSVTVRMPIG